MSRQAQLGSLFRFARWLWPAMALLAMALFASGVGPLFAAVRSLSSVPAEDLVYPNYLSNAYQVIQNTGISPAGYAVFELLLSAAVFTLYLAIAGLICWRRPKDRFALFVSYILLVMGLMAGVIPLAYGLARFDLAWSHAFTQLVIAVGWNAFIVFLFIFPDGRFVPGWTRWVLAAWLINWIAPEQLLTNSVIDALNTIVNLGTLLVAAGAQIYRYRRIATPLQKQQSKWVALGLTLFIAVSVVMFPVIEDIEIWFLDFVTFLLAILPLTIGIAILRAGLWNVDVVIRKTLIYGLLTVMLAVVYFGTVLVLQTLLGSLIGARSPVVIVVSTLIIAALFTPLRGRVQRAIDRRFYRQKYDAEQVLARFAQTARDGVELEALTAEVVRIVEETMRPESISVWLPAGMGPLDRRRNDDKVGT